MKGMDRKFSSQKILSILKPRKKALMHNVEPLQATKYISSNPIQDNPIKLRADAKDLMLILIPSVSATESRYNQ